MLATTTLSRQLKHYKRLGFHGCPTLAATLINVQHWQKSRMQAVHQELFSLPDNQHISQFLLARLYHFNDLNLLAQQLDKALQEKIKLDRWLPDGVLTAAILSFRLAYMTLQLDEQLARHALEHQLDINDTTMQRAIHDLNQFKVRHQQLDLLEKFAHALHRYSRSLMIQSGFKLAKSTAYRRQFHELYDYLAQAFAAMRASNNPCHFFTTFIAQEKTVLEHIATYHPQPFMPITC
ncbi:hypothetical protein ACF3NA_08590 [Alkanindiges sp. WGS2144]|uniref:FFLEELY motif protein n=1 Tax=Alkanindiges sp. WGS2144 TaxID=3366808 RepID=UPI0037539A45